jgi:hypothetical protein
VVREPTSASSQGSGDLTSPSKPTGSDASDRSNTSQLALPFSSDTGPESHDGETSTSSPLLPTASSRDWKDSPGMAREGVNPDGSRRSRTDQLARAIPVLPTPTAQPFGTMSSGYRDKDHPGVKKASLEHMMRHGLISSSAAIPASPSPTQASAAAPRTRATSGPSSPVLLASFDPEASCWRTFQATLASELPKFSQTLPRSGMTRSGRLYALPTLALPTDGSGGSASLNVPTPTASDAVWSDRDHSRRGIVGNHNLGLVDWARLLPTPTQDDGSNVTRTSGDYQSLVRSVGDLTNPPSEDGNE